MTLSTATALSLILRRELDGTHPLIVIDTDDESEVRQTVPHAIDANIETRHWSALRGVSKGRFIDEFASETEAPAAAFAWLIQQAPKHRSANFFYDLGPHLGDARTVRALKEAVEWARGLFGSIVLVERGLKLPASIANDAHRVTVPTPTHEELLEIVRSTVREVSQTRKLEASVRRSTLDAIARTMRGLTKRQAERVIITAATEDDRFNDDDLERVMIHKRNACADLEGVLEFVQAPVSMDSIGGLGKLKKWLSDRHMSSSVDAESFGLSNPRGMLLLGVQGAGKSLAAKAVATAWKVPLLRLDAGALYDKFVGESERKLRDSLQQADRMAPAVLWIDEIEKGFASASSLSSDGGLSRRMFGTLLTWMQERKSSTFLVATANDVSALPPELLRKGRFDEIFFIDLPGEEARRAILEIHLSKRKRDPKTFDLEALVAATAGYSGAEIEAGIESALREAFGDGQRPLETKDLAEAYRRSPPISVIMADRIAELREWAQSRCVPAE
ncbi:MAG: ATP-dependent zinc metalloprotease FtsH 3 [Planctomycetota bacterium]